MGRDLTYFYGLDEVSTELNSNVDIGLKNEYIAHFANAFSCKTMRIWLSTPEVIKVNKNDEIEFVGKGLNNLYSYLKKLRQAGVERFLLLDWWFVYPYGYKASDRWVVPDKKEEPDMYRRFILLQEKVRYEIARNFSTIEYFEMTNEPESLDGTFLHKNGWDPNNKNNEERCFTKEEIQDIVLDLNFFGNRGIKRANANAKMLLPSFCNFEYGPDYLDGFYNKIKSGNYPSSLIKSTKIEDYFDILSFHPYNLISVFINDDWINSQIKLHDVMVKHNDGDRKVWYTEAGWSDLRRENERLEIGQRYIDLFEYTKNHLPWVETIFLFRLFTLANRPENEGEDNFGLIYNEHDWNYPLYPKQAAIDIYKYIHGSESDTAPLFKYAKVQERELFTSTSLGNEDANLKVLVLGNHIAYQKAAPWNNYNESRGVGVDNKNKDYIHLLYEKLKHEYRSVYMNVVDMKTWEGDFYYDGLYPLLEKYKNEYDYILIRLGENVGNCSLYDHPFNEFIVKLASFFKTDKTKVVISNAFKKNDKLNDEIAQAAEKLGVSLIKIDDLVLGVEFKSKLPLINNEYYDCPNDAGMSIIATRLFEAFKKIIGVKI